MIHSTLGSVVAATTPSADTVSPGIAGFLVVFALALATVVLIRSMVGHLRKVRYSPEPGAEPEVTAPAGTSGDTSGETSAGTSGETPADIPADIPAAGTGGRAAPKAPGAPKAGKARPPSSR